MKQRLSTGWTVTIVLAFSLVFFGWLSCFRSPQDTTIIYIFPTGLKGEYTIIEDASARSVPKNRSTMTLRFDKARILHLNKEDFEFPRSWINPRGWHSPVFRYEDGTPLDIAFGPDADPLAERPWAYDAGFTQEHGTKTVDGREVEVVRTYRNIYVGGGDRHTASAAAPASKTKTDIR